MAFSRTVRKSWKKATGSGQFWKSVKLNGIDMKCMEGFTEN